MVRTMTLDGVVSQVLGTFIAEHEEGRQACERAFASTEAAEHTAKQLASVAELGGFEGWLINIEVALPAELTPHMLTFLRFTLPSKLTPPPLPFLRILPWVPLLAQPCRCILRVVLSVQQGYTPAVCSHPEGKHTI